MTGNAHDVQTVWVLGDQLNRSIGAMRDAEPGTHRVLLVESTAKLTSKRWHRQRAHLVVTSMRRFADELRDAGFEVDHRRATSLRDGFAAHVDEFAPSQVVATEPALAGRSPSRRRPGSSSRPTRRRDRPAMRCRRACRWSSRTALSGLARTGRPSRQHASSSASSAALV